MLGDVYYLEGKYDLSVQSLLLALPIFRDHQANRYHALCLVKLGYSYEQLQAYAEAIDYFEEGVVKLHALRLSGRAEQTQQALDRCRAAVAAAG